MAARKSALMPGAGASSIDLLMAALQRTVALVEMDGVAVTVGEDLHLDVARG